MNDIRTEVTPNERQALLKAARELAAKARAVSLDFYRKQNYSTTLKGDKSIVTEADKTVEINLRDEIIHLFPSHGIIGEELPDVNISADFTWSLDPIDGTLNFANRIPTWGTMIGLRFRTIPLIGIIDHPALNVCYYACSGLGAFCEDGNGKERKLKIDDANNDKLDPNEVIATSTRVNFMRTGEEAVFDAFVKLHPQTRIYHDCYAHTLTAEGNLGATLEYNLRVWDIAPTQVLIEEAGGVFTKIKVVPNRNSQPFESAVFGKPKVVQAICNLGIF